ncbi:MAG: hypothetical protein J6X18_12110 [Bacteroidales bacterium]|nr:hypothetical protein [Bacteroidales bacterium]
MKWLKCNMLINRDTDLYSTFRTLTDKRYVLLALKKGKTRNLFYATMLFIDDEMTVSIGGEEIYYFYDYIIVGYFPIDEVPEEYLKIEKAPFEGTLYQNGKIFQKYDNRDTLIKDYNSLYAIQVDTNGEPIVEDYNVKCGHAVWWSERMNKATSLSYETNETDDIPTDA